MERECVSRADGRGQEARDRPHLARPAFPTRATVLLLGILALGTPTVPACADEPLEARWARVKEMNPAAKERLLRQWECFQTMTADQQERLRRLHEELQRDPQAEELRRVMRRYYEWLKTLKPYQKAELAELAPRERVERIKKILQEQARKEARRLPPVRIERFRRLLQEQVPRSGRRLSEEDLEGLLRWMEEYVDAHAARLIEQLPASRRHQVSQQLAQIKDPQRRRQMLAQLWLRVQMANPAQLPRLTPSELAELRARLSPSTRQRLEELPAAEQLRAVTLWLRLMLLHVTAGEHLARMPREIGDEELADFLEHRLSPEQRDRLLSLSPEEMQRELWAWYLRSKTYRSAPAERPGRSKLKTPATKAQRSGLKHSRATAAPPRSSPPFPTDAIRRAASGTRRGAKGEVTLAGSPRSQPAAGRKPLYCRPSIGSTTEGIQEQR